MRCCIIRIACLLSEPLLCVPSAASSGSISSPMILTYVFAAVVRRRCQAGTKATNTPHVVASRMAELKKGNSTLTHSPQ